MFFLHVKSKVHHSLLPWDITFSRKLWFYWLTAFWPINGDPELCQNGVGVEISTIILVFTLDYFQEKLMTKFFERSKKTYLGTMWPFWPFSPKFGQKWIFLEKKSVLVIEYSNYLPLCQKSEKTNLPFLRRKLNWRIDGHTDRRTDRQPWFCRPFSRTEFQLLK